MNRDLISVIIRLEALERRVARLESFGQSKPATRKQDIWFACDGERGPENHMHEWDGPGYHGSAKDEYWCAVTGCSARMMYR